MLELAGLLLDFGLAIHGEAVSEEALGQSVTSNDAAGFLTSTRCQGDDCASVGNENAFRTHGIVTRIHKGLVPV